MSFTLFTSEFTDISNEDWEIKIVSQGTATDWGKVFKVGPDGFRLNYDFDQYDRCKPVIGSRVQLTMYQDDTETTSFEAFYDLLAAIEEGGFRIEIYKDQDVTNTLFWVGEIIPEQTIIPDEFPNAAITLTAVDGLANLKGIKYNNDGAAYTGTTTVLGHLHNLIQKLHVAEIWTATDIELKFFEDFIGKEYKDSIGTAQNKQLENAKISQPAFYNKDEDGNPQYFSCYEVLESLALTFNACVFMSEGSIWWVPLGAIQSHASAGLSIANYMLGNGTVTYNTVANTTIGAIFGSNSAQWEKLVGWERTTAPAFKEVKRTRDYQGNKPIVKDSLYTESDILASTILDDEDILYPVGTQFLIAGYLTYFYDGDGVSTDDSRVSRLIIGLKLRVGDSGGADRYLTRAVAFNSTNESYATFYNSIADTDPDTPSFYEPILDPVTWGASADTFDIVTYVFDKRLGTNAPHNGNSGDNIQFPFQFITPPLAAESTGLQISASLYGANVFGANDSDLVNTTDADFTIGDFEVFIYDDNNSQEFNTYDITAKNPDTSRYNFDQGTTLLGDRITDSDLGTISINNGSNYVDSTEWTSLQSSTASLSINGLGVRERLASNEDAKRIERGTLFKRGSTWIHPYTILTNTEHSSNFYQVSSLIFIAARSEYDIECMYLSRNITGITVANDNSKGTPGGGLPDVLPETKGPGPDNIVSDNTTKLGFISTDTYGITTVKISTGSSQTAINLPSEKATAGVEIVSISTAGAMAPVADGASGEFLKTNGSGVLSWSTAGGGGGWFGSTALMKVLPSEFMANDDGTNRDGFNGLYIEDDTSGKLGVRTSQSLTEMYVMKAIPTGYKATHVKVWASSTVSSGVTVYLYDHYTGDIITKGFGNTNVDINITDISSAARQDIAIRVAPGSNSILIYGVSITIAAI
jgi:hypothetical protein